YPPHYLFSAPAPCPPPAAGEAKETAAARCSPLHWHPCPTRPAARGQPGRRVRRGGGAQGARVEAASDVGKVRCLAATASRCLSVSQLTGDELRPGSGHRRWGSTLAPAAATAPRHPVVAGSGGQTSLPPTGSTRRRRCIGGARLEPARHGRRQPGVHWPCFADGASRDRRALGQGGWPRLTAASGSAGQGGQHRHGRGLGRRSASLLTQVGHHRARGLRLLLRLPFRAGGEWRACRTSAAGDQDWPTLVGCSVPTVANISQARKTSSSTGSLHIKRKK
ncbi:unnamed protein product, partial [Urochloa humidicola]